MQQITIAKKLFIGCGAMLAITLVVGAIAIRNVGKLGDSIERLGGHYTRAAFLASDTHSLTLDMVSTSRGILLRGHLKDLPRVTKLKEHYDEDLLAVKRNLVELISLTDQPDVRDILQDRIPGQLDNIGKANDGVYQSLLKEDLATADLLNNEKIVPMGASLTSAGNDLVELEARYSRQYADEATTSIPAARNISLLMILLSIGVGAAVVWVVRNIAKRILKGQVRIGRPSGIKGLPESAQNPAFSAAIGLLVYPQVSGIEHFRPGRTTAAPVGTGYMARVGRWLKDSF